MAVAAAIAAVAVAVAGAAGNRYREGFVSSYEVLRKFLQRPTVGGKAPPTVCFGGLGETWYTILLEVALFTYAVVRELRTDDTGLDEIFPG
jgi:hypothetical protein